MHSCGPIQLSSMATGCLMNYFKGLFLILTESKHTYLHVLIITNIFFSAAKVVLYHSGPRNMHHQKLRLTHRDIVTLHIKLHSFTCKLCHSLCRCVLYGTQSFLQLICGSQTSSQGQQGFFVLFVLFVGQCTILLLAFPQETVNDVSFTRVNKLVCVWIFMEGDEVSK